MEKNKIADIVLWKPALFGAKPEMIIKGGFITASRMGDINASIPTPQPVIYRNMYGAVGKTKYRTSVTFVSQLALDSGTLAPLGLQKQLLPVSNCRDISKRDMVLNSDTPDIRVDPKTYEVFADGRLSTCEPFEKLSLAQKYFLF